MFRHSQPEEQNQFPQDQIQQTYQPNICPSSNQFWYPPAHAHFSFQPHQFQQDNSSTWIPPSHPHPVAQHAHPTPSHQPPSVPIVRSSPGVPATPNPVSPPRHISLPQRMFQAVFSKPHDAEACWRCRNSHTKCEPMTQTPCGRCAANLGNLAIPCCRGDVCNLETEVPFLCRVRVGADQPPRDVQELPQDLQPGASLLNKTKQRQRHHRSKVKRSETQGSESAIFRSVVKTEVPNINRHNIHRELNVSGYELFYDDLIINIVWELEDNPDAASLMGITSTKHFVALLEAASFCESHFGPHNYKKRLVFAAMHLLLSSFAGLRLSSSDLLAASSHAYCTGANECISPALQGLTKYCARYAESLTKALFHKKRDSDNEWLLIFYSLCLQAHVRLALMTIEARLYPMDPTADGLAGLGNQRPLCAANYLRTASIIFDQISSQKNGKLAKKICNDLAQVQPSVYLRKANLDESDVRWKDWVGQTDMILKHLRMIFDVGVPINSFAATMHHHSHDIRPLALGPDRYTNSGSGWDMTMRSPAPTIATAATPNVVSQPSSVVHSSVDCGDGRSIMDSIYSATTGGASFDTWTMDTRSMDTMSIAETVTSNGTVVPDLPFSVDPSRLVLDHTSNFVLDHQGNFVFDNDFPLN